MTAAEHFAAQERRAETSRGAYRLLAHIIDDWLADYALQEAQSRPPGEGDLPAPLKWVIEKGIATRVPFEFVSVEVRLELERMRDHMRAAGQVPTPQETISVDGGTPP